MGPSRWAIVRQTVLRMAHISKCYPVPSKAELCKNLHMAGGIVPPTLSRIRPPGDWSAYSASIFEDVTVVCWLYRQQQLVDTVEKSQILPETNAFVSLKINPQRTSFCTAMATMLKVSHLVRIPHSVRDSC